MTAGMDGMQDNSHAVHPLSGERSHVSTVNEDHGERRHRLSAQNHHQRPSVRPRGLLHAPREQARRMDGQRMRANGSDGRRNGVEGTSETAGQHAEESQHRQTVEQPVPEPEHQFGQRERIRPDVLHAEKRERPMGDRRQGDPPADHGMLLRIHRPDHGMVAGQHRHDQGRPRWPRTDEGQGHHGDQIRPLGHARTRPAPAFPCRGQQHRATRGRRMGRIGRQRHLPWPCRMLRTPAEPSA